MLLPAPSAIESDLQQLGYTVIPTDVLVQPQDVVGDSGRAFATDDKYPNGILVADEYDKLLIYNLTEYERVVLLDTDALIVEPIDELFSDPAEALGIVGLLYAGLGEAPPRG